MDDKSLISFGLSKAELEQEISLKEAYFAMFEFLNTHWEGSWDYEISDVLSELSVWDSASGDKAPMDSSILPDWIAAVEKVISKDR